MFSAMRNLLDTDRYIHVVIRQRYKDTERVKYYYVVEIPHDPTIVERFHARGAPKIHVLHSGSH